MVDIFRYRRNNVIAFDVPLFDGPHAPFRRQAGPERNLRATSEKSIRADRVDCAEVLVPPALIAIG